jgi:hypothetical protein
MFDCISLVYAWFVPRVSHCRRVFHSSARPVCESAYWFAVSRRYARLTELLFVASVAVALMLIGGVVMVSASWLLALLLSPVSLCLFWLCAWCRRNANDALVFARVELDREWFARGSRVVSEVVS